MLCIAHIIHAIQEKRTTNFPIRQKMRIIVSLSRLGKKTMNKHTVPEPSNSEEKNT